MSDRKRILAHQVEALAKFGLNEWDLMAQEYLGCRVTGQNAPFLMRAIASMIVRARDE